MIGANRAPKLAFPPGKPSFWDIYQRLTRLSFIHSAGCPPVGAEPPRARARALLQPKYPWPQLRSTHHPADWDGTARRAPHTPADRGESVATSRPSKPKHTRGIQQQTDP